MLSKIQKEFKNNIPDWDGEYLDLHQVLNTIGEKVEFGVENDYFSLVIIKPFEHLEGQAPSWVTQERYIARNVQSNEHWQYQFLCLLADKCEVEMVYRKSDFYNTWQTAYQSIIYRITKYPEFDVEKWRVSKLLNQL